MLSFLLTRVRWPGLPGVDQAPNTRIPLYLTYQWKGVLVYAEYLRGQTDFSSHSLQEIHTKDARATALQRAHYKYMPENYIFIFTISQN
jgi:hypothetical protein